MQADLKAHNGSRQMSEKDYAIFVSVSLWAFIGRFVLVSWIKTA